MRRVRLNSLWLLPLVYILWLLGTFLWLVSHQDIPEQSCVKDYFGRGCDE